MSRHRLSGSRVGLAIVCGYSARGDIEQPPRVQSAAGSAGTTEHAYVEHTIKTGDEAPRSATHAAWVDEWWSTRRGQGWMSEQAFALDPESGQAITLPRAEHRDYSACPDGWIPLTIDMIRIDGTTAHVADLKTGHDPSWEPADRNPQLLTAALAVCKVYGCTRAIVSIVHATADGVRVHEAEIDALDLEDWRALLALLVASIATATPDPGRHCRDKWCAHYGRTCPATNTALAEVAPEPANRLPVVFTAREMTSPEHAAELYALARAAKARLDALWEALRVYAVERGPIHVAAGIEYSARTSSRESISLETRAAIDALKETLGPEWERAVSVETTKSGITLAARAVKARTGETLSAIEKRTMDALRVAGAVQSKPSTRVEERTSAASARR